MGRLKPKRRQARAAGTGWTPEGFPPIDDRVQYRSCGDPDCPRCRRNRWVRRLTFGLAGYGG